MKRFVAHTSFILMILLLLSIESATAQKKTANAPRVVPNSTEAMQHADFWSGRLQNPDAVVLTPAQIRALNSRNQSLPPDIKDINGDPYSIKDIIDRKNKIGLQANVADPLAMTTFPGDSLRARLLIHRDYFESGTYYDRREMLYDDEMKTALFDATDEDSVPDTIHPRHGILVTHTLNRVLPTHQYAGGKGSWLDHLQSTSLDVAMPVAVLHTSKDCD